MDTSERDKQASDLHASGMTWAAVALALHYANGSVARRAAMRHQPSDPPPITIEPDGSKCAYTITHKVATIVESEADTPEDEPNEFMVGDVLYHVNEPKAKFKFVKWNADGSAQVWGGEANQPMYRDFRAATLRREPSHPVEAIGAWAATHLYETVTINGLAEQFGAKSAAVRIYVQARPDVFRRIGRGSYEVRDPRADRNADRASA